MFPVFHTSGDTTVFVSIQGLVMF